MSLYVRADLDIDKEALASGLMATTTSNPELPNELLDHIVDLLHDIPGALKTCCLVSKSWIPRARRHLFSRIAFRTAHGLRSWKTAFPDPSTSPACYARFLLIKYPQAITVVDAEEGGLIQAFSQVLHLEMEIDGTGVDEPEASLVPFHGFLPALKFLRASFKGVSSLRVFDFIESFHHLQSLAVYPCDAYDPTYGFHEPPVIIPPSGPLAFAGSLELSLGTSVDLIASQLLSLPNGLHFRELRLELQHDKVNVLATTLVERCSSTLENLNLIRENFGMTTQRTGICIHTDK